MPDQIQPDDSGQIHVQQPQIHTSYEEYLTLMSSMDSFFMPTYSNKVKIVQEKVYILDDVDPSELDRLEKFNIMGELDKKGIKKQNAEEVIELSREEKEKAVVTNIGQHFLSELRGSDFSRNFKFIPIGKIVYGRYVRGSKEFQSGIILGHIINGVLCRTNTESFLTVAKGASLQGSSYIIYNLDKKAIQVYEKVWFDMTNSGIDENQTNAIISKMSFTIKDGELSGRVFGFAPSKKELAGTKAEKLVFELGESLKLGRSTYYAVIYHPGRDKNLKFCIADLEPNIPNLVGYNLPKDRSLKTGNKVIIKGSESKELYKIAKINPNDSSKRICKNGVNRQLDIVTLINIENGKQSKQYAKNLKVVD